MFGFIRAAASALRAGAARAAKAIRKPFQRKAPKASEAPTSARQAKGALDAIRETGIAETLSKPEPKLHQKLALEGKNQEKIFYARTQKLWEGLPNAARNEAIMEALGVDSIEEAYRIVLNDVERELGANLPDNWDTMTDEERYDYIMSILSRR